jgi:hypothetical protein
MDELALARVRSSKILWPFAFLDQIASLGDQAAQAAQAAQAPQERGETSQLSPLRVKPRRVRVTTGGIGYWWSDSRPVELSHLTKP